MIRLQVIVNVYLLAVFWLAAFVDGDARCISYSPGGGAIHAVPRCVREGTNTHFGGIERSGGEMYLGMFSHFDIFKPKSKKVIAYFFRYLAARAVEGIDLLGKHLFFVSGCILRRQSDRNINQATTRNFLGLKWVTGVSV